MESELLLALTQLSTLNASLPQLESTVTLAATAASVTYTVVTHFPRILVEWGATGTGTGGSALNVTFNGDTGAHYATVQNENNTATVSGASATNQAAIKVGVVAGTPTASYSSSGFFIIDAANQSAHYPTLTGIGATFQTSSQTWCGLYGGMWEEDTVITSVTLTPASGSLNAGSSFSFYGLT